MDVQGLKASIGLNDHAQDIHYETRTRTPSEGEINGINVVHAIDRLEISPPSKNTFTPSTAPS
jgi:hypothetical protein